MTMIKNELLILSEKDKDKIMMKARKLDEFRQLLSYDYNEISEVNHDINRALIEWTWKPENMDKWIDWKL